MAGGLYVERCSVISGGHRVTKLSPDPLLAVVSVRHVVVEGDRA